MILERVKYKNHLNETFDLAANGIFVEPSDLHDFEWTVAQKNDRISALERGLRQKTLPVTILADSEEAGLEARDLLFEIAEKDVLAMRPGRLLVGEYYYPCYITKSKKTAYHISGRHMKAQLTVTSDRPVWVRETTNAFRRSGDVAETAFLDFPFDFAYDFTSGLVSKELTNTGFVGTNFRMVIYGPCSDPAVYIGGHLYRVGCTVGAGEYLTIDSAQKQIYITQNSGEVINCFAQRDRTSYIFEKIPAGRSTVTWEGDFGFDVILLEERSEPRWT